MMIAPIRWVQRSPVSSRKPFQGIDHPVGRTLSASKPDASVGKQPFSTGGPLRHSDGFTRFGASTVLETPVQTSRSQAVEKPLPATALIPTSPKRGKASQTQFEVKDILALQGKVSVTRNPLLKTFIHAFPPGSCLVAADDHDSPAWVYQVAKNDGSQLVLKLPDQAHDLSVFSNRRGKYKPPGLSISLNDPKKYKAFQSIVFVNLDRLNQVVAADPSVKRSARKIKNPDAEKIAAQGLWRQLFQGAVDQIPSVKRDALSDDPEEGLFHPFGFTLGNQLAMMKSPMDTADGLRSIPLTFGQPADVLDMYIQLQPYAQYMDLKDKPRTEANMKGVLQLDKSVIIVPPRYLLPVSTQAKYERAAFQISPEAWEHPQKRRGPSPL